MQARTMQEVLRFFSIPVPTVILFHTHPDADAIGSAFAMRVWLEAMGSPAYCLCADEVPERLRFLMRDLQESVLPESLPAQFANARVITVDSAAPAQLGALYDSFGERISLMIDHHGRGTPYADYLILPEAAATGEIVYDLIAASGKEIPARCGELLYAAISGDTGGFRYSNVTASTHLRAAALVESGIDAARINHLLLEAKPLKLLQAEHAGLERLRLYAEGRVAVITFPFALREKMGLENEHLETLVDVARCVQGVEVAAAIRQTAPEHVYRVSMRSSVDFDVSAVCADFGGGGHVRAAGAAIRTAESIEQAETMLVEAVLRRFQ